MSLEYDHLWTAIKAIEMAGAELTERFGSTTEFEYRPTGELVTPADRDIEALLVERLSEPFPEHNFICEESTPEFVAKPRWIIDPLDGSINFCNGVPHYSVSIAFEGKHRRDIGLIYYVPRDQLYVAIEGKGAYKNNDRLELSGPSDIGDALMVTGFDTATLEEMDYNRFRSLLESTQGVRRVGSAAAELALVADGTFDIFFERGLDVWDAAAGSIIVEEAGGSVTRIEAIDGISGEMVLASSESIHQDVLAVLSKSDRVGRVRN